MTGARTHFVLLSSLSLCLLGLSACVPDDGVPDDLLIPTLDLEPVEQSSDDLSARVIGEQAGVSIHSFTAEEAVAGFEVPADEHVLFRCPAGSNIAVDVAVGNPLFWNEVRYWGYEYSNAETANKNAGKTGRELFDGRFFLSQGERNISDACYGSLHTQDIASAEMRLNGSSLYYLVISGNENINGNTDENGNPFLDVSEDVNNNCQLDDGEDLNGNGRLDLGEDANGNDRVDTEFPRGLRFMVSCVDADEDLLNTGTEAMAGTDPQVADTDQDGIPDGIEIMGENRTKPLNPDTDGGGQPDGAEDINKNGVLDIGETNPNDATDDAPVHRACNDGLVTGAEECDPGVSDSEIPSVACVNASEVCNAITCQCALPADIVCGDGLIRGEETCDDGGEEDGDGCSAECTVEDPFVCMGEPSQCNLPLPTLPGASSAAASSVAISATCGDGDVQETGADELPGTADDEQCDDKNAASNDGCTACHVDQGYLCDSSVNPSSCAEVKGTAVATGPSLFQIDPNSTNPRNIDYTISVTNNGLGSAKFGSLSINSSHLTYDTANPTEGCVILSDPDYEFLGCDFGTLQSSETKAKTVHFIISSSATCNDGITFGASAKASELPNPNSIQTISSKVQTIIACGPYCGDGDVQLTGADELPGTADDEQCDDENFANNDGCSACKIDQGYVCSEPSGQKSVCTLTGTPADCGNDIPEAGEACDEGDELAGGDCSADCQCDLWGNAQAFLAVHCPGLTTDAAVKDCFLPIQAAWTINDDYTITPPDIDCSGENTDMVSTEGERQGLMDIVSLSQLVLEHYPNN